MNTLIEYIKDNHTFRYVDFNKKNPVKTVLHPRSMFKKLLPGGVIIKKENELNVIYTFRGEILKFSDEEVNVYFSNCGLAEEKRVGTELYNKLKELY